MLFPLAMPSVIFISKANVECVGGFRFLEDEYSLSDFRLTDARQISSDQAVQFVARHGRPKTKNIAYMFDVVDDGTRVQLTNRRPARLDEFGAADNLTLARYPILAHYYNTLPLTQQWILVAQNPSNICHIRSPATEIALYVFESPYRITVVSYYSNSLPLDYLAEAIQQDHGLLVLIRDRRVRFELEQKYPDLPQDGMMCGRHDSAIHRDFEPDSD